MCSYMRSKNLQQAKQISKIWSLARQISTSHILVERFFTEIIDAAPHQPLLPLHSPTSEIAPTLITSLKFSYVHIIYKVWSKDINLFKSILLFWKRSQDHQLLIIALATGFISIQVWVNSNSWCMKYTLGKRDLKTLKFKMGSRASKSNKPLNLFFKNIRGSSKNNWSMPYNY